MAVCAEGDDGMGHMIDSSTGSKPDLVGLLGAGDQAREVASYLPLGTEIFWAVSPEYLGPAGRDQVDITAPPASVIEQLSIPVDRGVSGDLRSGVLIAV